MVRHHKYYQVLTLSVIGFNCKLSLFSCSLCWLLWLWLQWNRFYSFDQFLHVPSIGCVSNGIISIRLASFLLVPSSNCDSNVIVSTCLTSFFLCPALVVTQMELFLLVWQVLTCAQLWLWLKWNCFYSFGKFYLCPALVVTQMESFLNRFTLFICLCLDWLAIIVMVLFLSSP